MPIQHLDPASFDQAIRELHDKRQAEKVREAKEVLPLVLHEPEPLPEPIVQKPRAPTDSLLRVIRNSTRHDLRVVWTVLHKDVYQALLTILSCTDIAQVSEASYLIYDKMARVDWRKCDQQYFYEVAHAEYLGLDSWAKLMQSQLLYVKDSTWTGVPVVAGNRYKVPKPFNVHVAVTGYMLTIKPGLVTHSH